MFFITMVHVKEFGIKITMLPSVTILLCESWPTGQPARLTSCYNVCLLKTAPQHHEHEKHITLSGTDPLKPIHMLPHLDVADQTHCLTY